MIQRIPEHTRAVIFDYDGVIADTFSDNLQAWQHAFASHGVTITKEDFMEAEGMNPPRIVSFIGKKYNLPESFYGRIVEEKQQYYKEHNSFRLYPEIEEIVRMLKEKGQKIGIVSGAAASQIKSVLPQDLFELFDAFVSGDTVNNPKPHPEPYQTGLELLGVSRAQAIAIEDSPLGIQSAKEAGIYCIGVLSTRKKEAIMHADRIVQDIRELKAVLGTIV